MILNDEFEFYISTDQITDIRDFNEVTPQAASVWEDVTIYSENTAIAIGEGVLVKGVSKGDTYIVVKTRGNMASAYHVIVE